MAEKFTTWAKRVTESGEYDLSKVIEFIAECHAQWREDGKDWTGPWWRLVRGRKNGLPKKMRSPKDGRRFVFPIFDVPMKLLPGLITARAVDPRCPRCGGKMNRRALRDPSKQAGEFWQGGPGSFFGCRRYPMCRGACDAWFPITGTVPAPAVDETVDETPVDESPAEILETPADETPDDETETPDDDSPYEELRAAQLVDRIVALVAKARGVVEAHGMTLPIGYRTVAHLAEIAVLANMDENEAWRLWVDGRVSEQERAKFDAAGLPSGSPKPLNRVKDQPVWYGTVATVLDAGMPVFLVGGAGTGKTRFARWYAERVDKKLEMVVGSGDVAGRELWVARRDAKGGNTSNVLGPAARACADGSVLLLDEVDGFDSNSLLPMNAVLNGDRELSVPVLGEIKVNVEVRIIAAANTNGRTKDRTYNARNRLDGAFLNRFAVVVRTVYEKSVDVKVGKEAVLKALAARKEA